MYTFNKMNRLIIVEIIIHRYTDYTMWMVQEILNSVQHVQRVSSEKVRKATIILR